GQNVVIIEEKGKTANVSITAVNLPTSKHSQIKWESSDEGVAKVVPNGSRATVTAVSEGEAVISVAHEESQDTLKIYVRVGSEYVIPD
ncbi:Ig-like domain-containing protein, partial [Streptomyces caniscabiei]|uniref:Ig-like domain-containing protein n=1 Tax=Streptomyces caniscabiei TaxID=2746961 RepID=UPI0038F7A197